MRKYGSWLKKKTTDKLTAIWATEKSTTHQDRKAEPSSEVPVLVLLTGGYHYLGRELTNSCRTTRLFL
ncbi:hypothetical protein BDB00DRAFT_865787 [Zychaea mexicana]|uniref:uncharacterized protein n=1 Tax=Zychaea mexicana TaxID=64656 RepID=UPI0022FF24F1|nr:uncharacterized protein BDB00DRAFT_865787 [Zychaea mexicana]KAI9466457.1 hypothetical protein BDB00DRAFT_865787 [Zychaea mexicana]